MRKSRTLSKLRCFWAVVAVLVYGPALRASERYPIPPDTVVVMQTGPCELGCPVYRVMVFADGDVVWQGMNHVRKTGLALGHITPDLVREVLDAFRAIGYLRLENVYGYRGKGCASTKNSMRASVTYTSVTTGGVSHSLSHDDGCEGAVGVSIGEAETALRRVTGLSRWVR